MSSEPSHLAHDIPSTLSSLEAHATSQVTVPLTIYQDPLYSRIFHFDEDILEEMNTPD